MKVQILSRKFIHPSSPTPYHLQNFQLSSIEQLGPTNYAPIIFYYAANEEDHGENYIEERSKKLQKTLAETLTLFYPLAGRYTDDNLLVDCNDKGAEFLEAQVNGHLAQFLNREELDIELMDLLVAHPSDQPENPPLIFVQFNMFECGGLAISVSMNHKTTDGFTICEFTRTWATAFRIGIENLNFFPRFPLASICPPKDLISNTARARFQRSIADNTVINKRFVFNSATISKLKAWAKGGGSNAGLLKNQPSRVEVVSALVWMTLIRVSQARHGGHLRPSFLSHAFNMRGRLDIPIPEYSCGCFVSNTIVQFIPDDDHGISKTEFGKFVSLVHDGIRSKALEFAQVSNGDELFFQVTSNRRKHKEVFSKSSEVDCYLFTSWCRFPLYEVDFGWGKPRWASSICIPKGAVLLVDTRDGDGIEIVVGLDEKSMILFQRTLHGLGFDGENFRLFPFIYNARL